ncbi:putative ribonuclease H-like superfamily [Helianthus annuus]|nr:putative ribonuclease H-like superfamily [Helianthus annuus]
MMRRIIKSATGHPLKNLKVLLPQDLLCAACSLGKLITRPSQTKLIHETPSFLERIQGDICGPIHPPCGPFRYFLVLIDASSRWSHVSLLATRNVAFARLLAQIIQLRANFPTIKLETFGWIMRESSHLKRLMTIVCQSGLMLNIQYLMFTHKTV